MTDYNDGNWHNWGEGFDAQGGPVHEKSEVEVFGVQKSQGPFHQACPAGHVVWPWVKVFRVTKAHREPREFWIIVDGDDYIYTSLESAEADKQEGEEIIHVREVLE